MSSNNYMLDPVVRGRGGERLKCLSVKRSKLQLGVVVQVFNLSTEEIEAGGYLSQKNNINCTQIMDYTKTCDQSWFIGHSLLTIGLENNLCVYCNCS